MLPKRVCSYIAGLSIIFAGNGQANSVNLYTFPEPPYQEASKDNNGQPIITGLTVETLSCSAELAGWEPKITLAPQSRAIYALERNSIDGYFATDPSTDLDQKALRSDPVALEKWYFFSNSADIDPQNARIGVVNGSNEQAWLLDQHYDIFISVSTPQQLVALLERDRIDMALMDDQVMARLTARSAGEGDPTFAHQFVRYAPLYLYISQAFASRHPGFMDGFNTFLPDCITKQFELTPYEADGIRRVATPLIKAIEERLDYRKAIQSGPDIKNLADILLLDNQWQAVAPYSHSPLAGDIRALEASGILREFAAEHRDLVTEIMLTNSLGTLVAMSQLTSDFWQGDENKFRNLTDVSPEDLYLSPIRFDESTGRFQVTVSHPVIFDSAPSLAGVLVIGLDIERALTTSKGTENPQTGN